MVKYCLNIIFRKWGYNMGKKEKVDLEDINYSISNLIKSKEAKEEKDNK